MALRPDAGRQPRQSYYGERPDYLSKQDTLRSETFVGGNPFSPGTWEYEFFATHGRRPNDQDRQDCAWGDAFYREHGRPPADTDWRARWFQTHGGGPAGGAGDEDVTMGDVFRLLELPATTAEIPFGARPWYSYVVELLRTNTEFAIPVPTVFEDIEQPEDEEIPAYMENVELFTTQWQHFLHELEELDISEQQALAGWRYTPETGWARGATPMMQHPGYV